MADEKDVSDDEEYSQKWWVAQLAKREKELDKEWRDPADAIVRRYLDRRSEGTTGSTVSQDMNARKYNIFWANTQIIKAALYATPPKPAVSRQYGDSKDDVARTAAMMLQRILMFGLDKDGSDMHSSFLVAVEDRLIPGLGQVWLRLDVETEKVTVPAVVDEMGNELAPASEGEKIIEQEVLTEYVHWRDFLWETCRVWSECGWVARRVWMRKTKFTARFGKELYDKLKDSAKDHYKTHGKYPKGFTDGKVEVFEVWCKDTNKVYWVNRFADELLDSKDDPLQLDDFFPCPAPLLATHTTNDMVPRPDYTMVQDQYEELDILNMRISILTKALRVVGAYDKNNKELAQMLTGAEFNMVAVENWQAFSEQGGLKNQVDWFPVEVIAAVLEKLMNQRVAVINQIYELTSISDIMRGASNPRDTLGAQKLKAQYSSVRLQLSQQDVGKFVRHALRLKVEIVCRHFQPERIAEISQIQYTESGKYVNEALALLKNYHASEYRIEVGEETLSLADYNAERELRLEYLTSVGQFVSQAGQIIEPMPQALPYLLKIIAWATSAFRGSSDIESVLDEAIQAASQPQQQKQDPAVAKEEAAMKRIAAETQAAQQQDSSRAQADIAVDNAQSKNALKQTVADVLKSGIEHANTLEQNEEQSENAAALQAQKTQDAKAIAKAKPKPTTKGK